MPPIGPFFSPFRLRLRIRGTRNVPNRLKILNMIASIGYLLTLSLVSADPRPATAHQVEVQLVQGARISGELVQWKDQQILLGTSTGAATVTSLEAATIAAIVPKPVAAQPPEKPLEKPTLWLDLSDGSRLAATEYTVVGAQSKITFADGESLELPTAEVVAVRLQAASDAVALEWSRILGKKIHGDVLVTANLDTVDYHQGVVHDVSDKLVQFELDGETLKVKRSKVFGLIYYRADAATAPASAYTIADTTGSRWVATAVKFDGNNIEWTSPSGRTLHRSLDRIAKIDLSCGKIIYLSDLKPDSEKYTPFFATEHVLPGRDEFYRVHRDQNLEGKSIRIRGQVYAKGLSMHSRSEVAWTLPGKFSRLEAVAGIDDDVRPQGNVKLRILGDGKLLLEKTIFAVDLKADPLSIGIDLSGVRRLVIVADFGENLDIGDQLDLGNLRLIK